MFSRLRQVSCPPPQLKLSVELLEDRSLLSGNPVSAGALPEPPSRPSSPTSEPTIARPSQAAEPASHAALSDERNEGSTDSVPTGSPSARNAVGSNTTSIQPRLVAEPKVDRPTDPLGTRSESPPPTSPVSPLPVAPTAEPRAVAPSPIPPPPITTTPTVASASQEIAPAAATSGSRFAAPPSAALPAVLAPLGGPLNVTPTDLNLAIMVDGVAPLPVEGPYQAILGVEPLPFGAEAVPGETDSAEPVVVMEAWPDAWRVDLKGLEAALAAFLAGLDRLNLPKNMTAWGATWPAWMLAMGLAAVACEAARRQMRRDRLAPAGDDLRRLAAMFLPPLED